MKKRFLGIICLIYVFIIIFVIINNTLKNFLAPSMQKYLLASILPLLIIGIVLIFNDNISYKFKISDLILLLPLVMLFVAGDGNLSTSLAANRASSFSKTQKSVSTEDEKIKWDDYGDEEYDFSNPDFDVVDASFVILANYITYEENAHNFVGKTIRVRGFTMKDSKYLPEGYFGIGKYSVSCCAADASFLGFAFRYNGKVKDNTWYEAEGILEKINDSDGNPIMAIKVINLEKIDSKTQSEDVYPCYSYDNGECREMNKYDDLLK